MTKAILARELKNSGISHRAAIVCIDALLESMAAALSKGERIELRGFGTFYISKQSNRKTSINGNITIPEHGRVLFRPCKKLRQAVWEFT
jgi:integration host factor subunit beta